ncbi:hypothetical protein [Jatrophihabitans sp.]|uniref:hypothetical protein n=1 Tax=Jatrophihabitans sp. TaxID=1932789 RepID=UPI0030C77118|nr:hypothetical protein [Jatrophihabitans sp.]
MRRWIRLLLGISVLLATAVTGALSLGDSALAGTPGRLDQVGSYVGGVTFPGSAPGFYEPLVAWQLPGSGGRIGTCISAGLNGPVAGTYGLVRTVHDPVYGELNHLYSHAETSDVHLAELSALNSHAYDEIDRDVQWHFVERREGGLSVADASAMLARAKRLAGPYTVAVGWPAADTLTGVRYVATVKVVSASGVPVPGATVTLTGSGVTLEHRTRTTSSSGVAAVGFRLATGTSATASIAATVPAWTTFDEYTSSGEQSMVVEGRPVAQHGSHTGPVTRTRPVGLIKVGAGDGKHRPVPGYVFRISDSAGHVIRAAVTTRTTPVSLGSLRIGATYRATEIGVPNAATLYIPSKRTLRFTVPVGASTWTVSAADPAIPTPALHTSVTATQVVVGERLSDRVTISGDDGEAGVLTARLLGPVPPPGSGRCSDLPLAAYSAAPAQLLSAAVHGDGVVVVRGPVVTKAGCYGWAESLRLTPSGATAVSPPTAPDESSLVTSPGLHTAISSQVALPGQPLRDAVTITGLGDERARLRAVLYGPVPDTAGQGVRGCAGVSRAAWVKAPHAGVVTVEISGDGALTLAPITVRRLGCYTFGEELTPEQTPGHTVRTPLGLAVESAVVIAPTLQTVASPQQTSAGGSVLDRLTVRGTAGVSGTVGGSLLGPVAPPVGGCAAVQWAGAPVAAQLAPVVVHGDGQYVTAPVPVRAAGCYTFVEVLHLTGAPGSIAAADTGQPAEAVLVPAAPTPVLAVTGFSVTGLATAAGGLVGAGLLLLGGGRRRVAARHRMA